MGADHHAGRGLLGGEAGAHREAAADALGRGQDVGLDPVMLVGVHPAGPGVAALHLVEDQHQVVGVGEAAQALHELGAGRADAALALDRLDQEAGGVPAHRRLGGLEIVELDDLEAGQQRREAVAQLVLVGGADRAERAAVEGAGEGDQLVLVGPAVMVVVAARGLDRALDRLGAAVGEEDGVGEGEVDQPLRERLALRRAVEVGDVDQGRRLVLDRLGQVRMAVAEQVDGDAAGEVEIFLALLAVEIDPLPAHRPHRRARIDGHERRDRHGRSFLAGNMQKRRPFQAAFPPCYREMAGAASIAARRPLAF